MDQPVSPANAVEPAPVNTAVESDSEAAVSNEPLPSSDLPLSPKPSYVKLAMRNMVRKRGKSLFHFALTTVGLLGLFVGLAYLTR
jgi:Protein of unknown function (DUF3285)